MGQVGAGVIRAHRNSHLTTQHNLTFRLPPRHHHHPQDTMWRENVTKISKDLKVLVVADIPNLVESYNEQNEMLDVINKGCVYPVHRHSIFCSLLAARCSLRTTRVGLSVPSYK